MPPFFLLAKTQSAPSQGFINGFVCFESEFTYTLMIIPYHTILNPNILIPYNYLLDNCAVLPLAGDLQQSQPSPQPTP